MNLEQELSDRNDQFEATAPASLVAFLGAKIKDLSATFAMDGIPKAWQPAPDFTLPDVKGKTVSLLHSLADGPVVLTFYRGAWCPFCNLQLASYQRALPEIKAAGGYLIAISPQRPDGSLSMTEKNGLTFDVLSDVGNAVSRSYGLLYSIGDDLRKKYQSLGVDLAAINVDESGELPIPATFVIDRDGRIRLAHADIDYRKRLFPETIVRAIREVAGV